jgi:hypothetical protein
MLRHGMCFEKFDIVLLIWLGLIYSINLNNIKKLKKKIKSI